MNAKIVKRRGNNIVISAPSGVGKSTIIENLITNDSELVYSISATTRSPRAGEINGTNYHFKSSEDFYKLIEQKAFVEYAEVFGNFYGTLTSEVQYNLSSGNDILFDIDWQGATAVRNKMPQDTISIFILPPSLAELERRLRGRNKDDEKTIAYRMAKSRSEISHYYQYDYIIVNDNLEQAIVEIKAIILANRLRKERLTGLDEFISQL